MNRQLVKQYKAEFDHWINGGNIRVLFITDKKWEVQLPNCPTFDWTNPENVKAIVIDDEYFEFRKALAEGKTVQYFIDDFTGYRDVTSVGNHCVTGAKQYRIKPEPEFKIGDWVKRTGYSNIFKVNSICNEFLHSSTSEYYLIESMELWKPIVGELVVVSHGATEDRYTVFRYNNEPSKNKLYPLEFLQTIK